MDKGIDDVGFLEQVVSQLPGKFNADQNRVFLSGKSAGGILLHAALCRSPVVAQKARAAVDILGGLPQPMADACSAPGGKASMIMIHGVKDEHLPFNSGVVLDYIPFKGTKDAAYFWKEKILGGNGGGNGGPSTRSLEGGQYSCDTWGGGGGGGAREVVLCGIRDAGHTTDIPYVGAPFDLAWTLLKEVTR